MQRQTHKGIVFGTRHMLMKETKIQKPTNGYKMLVLDLDDTLLTDDYRISERNKKRLIEAQEKGIKVVLASGRPTPAMIKFAKELKLDYYDSYMISFNGGVVTSMRTNENLFETSLTPIEIHGLYDYSVTKKVQIITYSQKGVVSESNSEYIDVELSLTGIPHHRVDSFKEEVTYNAAKCILLEHPDYLKVIEKDLKQLRPDLSVARSKPFFLEVMPKGIDKAASIERLANMLSINQEEVIAVGNAGNDLSMVKYAGLGVWVDNVDSELRHEADLIVASNNNDGVAEVVEQYIL